MKLLLFSDLHTNAAAAERLVQMATHADVVIGAGDFANVRRGISVCIDILQAIRVPAVLVPGNNETCDELRAACARWHNATVLHGAGVEIEGVPFYGLGGGIPVTPFGNWSYDFTEDQAAQLLADCPAGAVLVSHSPPKGAVDVASSGKNLGSTAVRDAVLRLQPRLVVCGHIHASARQRVTIRKTPVINAGPSGILFDLGDSGGGSDS